MLRKLILAFILIVPLISIGQERFFLHADKLLCNQGDTIWVRAYLTTDAVTPASTSFYIELYNDRQMLISREVFPMVDHFGMGQITVPGVPGNYWLRAYTRNTMCEAILPVNVVSTVGVQIIRAYAQPIKKAVVPDNSVSLEKDGDDYVIHIADSIPCNYSIAVTDTTNPGIAMMLSFPVPDSFQAKWDTSHLVFRARLNDSKKRKQKRAVEMITYFQQDSISSPIKLLPVDTAGNVVFPSMFFYNKGSIHYQLNKKQSIAPLVELTLSEDILPSFRLPPASVFRRDTIQVPVQITKKPDTATYLTGNVKNLKLIEIKEKYQDRHLALNKLYVMSEEFAPIEHYTFDLRNPINPGSFTSVLEYLYAQLPANWFSSTLQSCREGIQYYIDERPVAGNYAGTRSLKEFAYAKVYQDLHPPCPAICLYTRKGKDLEALPTSLGILTVRGYDKPLSWTTPDRITWLWEPYLTSKTYRFHMPSKSFKLIMLGTTADGNALKFEKVVKNGTL